jgi:hypothetical protein
LGYPTAIPKDPFNPLFFRDRLSLLVSGLVGSNHTFGDEVIHSGIWRRLSYSLGQFPYETGGFRPNNDLDTNIYNAFIQGSLSPTTSVQAEFRHTDTVEGDRGLRFSPDDFSPNRREERDIDTMRIGFHQAFGGHSDFIASVIYREVDRSSQDFFSFGGSGGERIEEVQQEDAILAEAQHLFRWGRLGLISGVGHFATTKSTDSFEFESNEFGSVVFEFSSDLERTNAYLYSQINLLSNLSMTLGISADFFKGIAVERNQINPKIGLIWSPFRGTTLRAAAFRVLNPNLSIAQTIEPTHVAGFNQFFGTTVEQATSSGVVFEPQGSDVWRYGVALDQKLSPTLLAGAEYSKRNLKVPFAFISGSDPFSSEREEWKEDLARAYLYWTPHPWVAARAEYYYEKFDRPAPFSTGLELETYRVPLGIEFSHPSGFGAGIKATYINQEIMPDLSFEPRGSDRFWVVDLQARYRYHTAWAFSHLALVTCLMKNSTLRRPIPGLPWCSEIACSSAGSHWPIEEGIGILNALFR